MKTFLVGGAVRDALLGRPTSDLDWVVVGAQPADLLGQGYRAVGKDFPVFLHPISHDEYALARTERKTGPGYKGFELRFDPSVTLDQDLVRRDLTINAMAVPHDRVNVLADGTFTVAEQDVIDPFGGAQDLRSGVLRHVGDAFAEDPVRILRLARFAARFSDFTVADATFDLMKQMVIGGEVDALVPERVWQELATGLMEQRPSRMLEVLRACGALRRLLPEVDALWGVPQRADYHPEIDCGVHLCMVLDRAAQLNANLATRYACLCHDLGKATTPVDLLPKHHGHEDRSVHLLAQMSERLRVPTPCRELAQVVAAEHGNIHRSNELNAAALLRLFDRLDVFRRPLRLPDILMACQADAQGRLGLQDQPYAQAERLAEAFAAVQAVDTARVAKAAQQDGLKGPAIGRMIQAARHQALAHHLTLTNR